MFAFARISTRNDWIGRLVLCLALPSLVLTYSRGAWIALMVAAPLYWVYVSKHRLKVGVFFVVVTLTAYPILAPRLAAVDYGDVIVEAQTGMTSNSFSFRVMIWKELVKLWSQNPVLGWGLATTPTINPIRVVQDNRGFAAHNDAVRHLVETGLIGLLCYLNFLRVLGMNLFRMSRQFAGTYLGSYALAAFAIYVAIVVESFTVGDALLESSFMFHFLGLAAVLEGISRSEFSSSVKGIRKTSSDPAAFREIRGADQPA
jgi:O-antigen ligase